MSASERRVPRLTAHLRTLIASESARPVRFFIVGVWNTAFGWLAYSSFLFITDALGWSYLIATIPAQIVGIVQAYFTQRDVAFRADDSVSKLRSFMRFNAVYWLIYVVTTPIFAFLVSGLGLTPRVASAALTLASATVSYAAHLRYTFRRPGTG